VGLEHQEPKASVCANESAQALPVAANESAHEREQEAVAAAARLCHLMTDSTATEAIQQEVADPTPRNVHWLPAQPQRLRQLHG